MSYIIPNKDDLDEIILNLFKAAGFSNTDSSGTPEHALYKLLTGELYKVYSTLDSAYKEALPLDATGTTLDLWANFFGTPRTLSTYAKDDTKSNVYFSFPIDYNISAIPDVVIPINSKISANGVGKFYKTTEEVTIETTQGTRIKYVPVISDNFGENSNINSGELNTHELNVEGLEVTNKFAITTGTSNQIDSDLKLAMQNIFGKTLGTNLSSIQKSIMDLPGISNVQIYPLKKGTGTFSAFIDSVAPVVSPELINKVRALVSSKQALGIKGFVEYPDYKAVTIKFEIMIKDGLTEDEVLTELANNETNEIVDYINNIARGSSFKPNDVLRYVLDNSKVATSAIKSLKIGTYNIMDQTIIDNELVSPVPKHIEFDQKWFCSTDLITFCTVSFN